jgi:hypothetical protein
MPNQLKKVHGLLGVNLQAEPRFLKDGEAVRTKNLVPLLSGQLAKRKTVTNCGELYRDALVSTDIPVGIYSFPLEMSPSSFYGLLIFTRAGVLYAAVFGPPTPTLEAAYTERQLSEGQWDGIQPVVFMHSDKIYVLPGKSGTCATVAAPGIARSHWERSFEAGVIFETQRNPDVVPEFGPGIATGGGGWGPLDYFLCSTLGDSAPAGAVPYRYRVVYWDLGAGYEDCILFSDNENAGLVGTDPLEANGRYIRAGSKSTGRIVSCVPVMLTSVGTPASTGLLIISESGCRLLTGEPNQSTDSTDMLGDLQVQDMNVRTSCVSHQTVVTTPYGTFWLGSDDIWVFTEGQLPRRVGGKLRPLLVGQPRSGLKRLFAYYHDGFFRIALYGPGTAAGLTVAPDEHWLLDLRSGAPQGSDDARWFGPQVYIPVAASNTAPTPGLFCARQDLVAGSRHRLVSAVPVNKAGTYAIHLVDVEGGTGEDYAVETADVPVERRFDNSPTFEFVSKDDDFGDFNTDKLYTGAEIGMLPTRPTGVTVTATMGGGEASGEDEQTLVAGGFMLDADDLDDRTLAETYDHQLSYPDEMTRPMGKSVQLTVADMAGYVITEFNDEMRFEWTDGVLPTAAYTATVARGAYANLEEVLDVVVGAMREVLDGADSFSHDAADATTRANVIRITSDLGFDWRPQGALTAGTWNTKTASLLSMLGFDPESSAAMSQWTDSVDPVHWNPAGGMSLTEVVLKVETFPNRRPS